MGCRDDPTPLLFCFAALALFLGTASADGAAPPAGSVSFGYSGWNGPEKWGSLSPLYQACGAGKSQSPVDVNRNETVENKKLGRLVGKYRPVEATLLNSGHNVMIYFNDSPGEVEMVGKTYRLKQMHWHSPSEHTIDGQQYPLELHMVHKADDNGSFAVAAVLYQYGPEDKFLQKIKGELEELAKEKSSTEEDQPQVPLKKMEYHKMVKMSSHSYYRYTGSLTSPPCWENVVWSVLGRRRTVSREQVEALREPLAEGYKVNARPLQPLNGRKVELYEEH